MIPASFEYRRAGSVSEAVNLLVEHGPDAKLLAGGHSLLPLMKLRLSVPSLLVDVGGLSEFSFVRDEGGFISVGALTRHHDLERSELLARECLCCPTSPVRSATRRCATGGRSAGRWPTGTLRRTCRRPYWPLTPPLS